MFSFDFHGWASWEKTGQWARLRSHHVGTILKIDAVAPFHFPHFSYKMVVLAAAVCTKSGKGALACSLSFAQWGDIHRTPPPFAAILDLI